MYDFGFYLEHSVCFQAFLTERLSIQPINNIGNFNLILDEFKKTCKRQLTDIIDNNNHIVAFGIRFDKVCDIKLDSANSLLQYDKLGDHMYFDKATKNATAGMEGGTYIWRFGDEYRYVGETKNLKKRVSLYSDITKKLVDDDDRRTNRRVNAEICKTINEDRKSVTLYFYPTQNHHHDIEQYLLQFKSKSVFNLNEKV